MNKGHTIGGNNCAAMKHLPLFYSNGAVIDGYSRISYSTRNEYEKIQCQKEDNSKHAYSQQHDDQARMGYVQSDIKTYHNT